MSAADATDAQIVVELCWRGSELVLEHRVESHGLVVHRAIAATVSPDVRCALINHLRNGGRVRYVADE